MKDFFNEIFNLELLKDIIREMQRSNYKHGLDNMNAKSADLWLDINYDNLLNRLQKGEYSPMPVMGFSVTKKNGHFRRLVKPTAVDTMLQKAVVRYLEKICEPVFSDNSHAYRPQRGGSTALKRYCESGTENQFVLKLDPTDFFGNIDYAILEKALEQFSDNKKLNKLIMKFVKVPVIEDGEATYRKKGIPQGIPLAPILSNMYMHSLDRYLEENGYRFIRYADDVVIFGDDYNALNELYGTISDFMQSDLGLTMNRHKLSIEPPDKTEYLGHRFYRNKFGILAFESNTPAGEIYHSWNSTSAKKRSKSINILSDGILRKKDFSLLFESAVDKTNIPIYSCESINVFSDVVFDSGFLETAMKNRITVNVFDRYGQKTGTFLPQSRLLSPPTTISQLELYSDPKARLYFASRFVLGSIHNLRLNIRYYRKQSPNVLFDNAIRRIDILEKQVKKCTDYNELLLLEARVRQAYYSCYDAFIKQEGFTFGTRTRKPPKNEVNAMISFGNTLLYNLIANEINRTALDIRIGFLHATNKRRESLNLDIAELFKPLIVDRVVFTTINRRMIGADVHFEHEENGAVYLNNEGKQIFIRAFYDKLDTSVTVKDHTETYRQIIFEEVRKLIRCFRKKNLKYTPFKQVR